MELQYNVDAIKKYVGIAYNKTSQNLKTLFLRGSWNNKYKLLNITLREYYAFIINNETIWLIETKGGEKQGQSKILMYG